MKSYREQTGCTKCHTPNAVVTTVNLDCVGDVVDSTVYLSCGCDYNTDTIVEAATENAVQEFLDEMDEARNNAQKSEGREDEDFMTDEAEDMIACGLMYRA